MSTFIPNPILLLNVEAVTSDPTPTSNDSGTVYTNQGAGSQVTITLPEASAGRQFTFIVEDSDGITVQAAAGDTIRQAGSVSSAGGTASSTTIGDTITLIAISSSQWFAVASHGTWTLA